MIAKDFVQNSIPFLEYLHSYLQELPSLPLRQALPDPQRSAIISVDVINGFCHFGPLASPRVKAIIGPIVDLFQCAWDLGLRYILLTQDNHAPEAVEFGQFPPHCVRGTPESETVPEFKALPFFEQITILEKNSISSGLDTGLEAWLAAHQQVDTFIVVGDCTDLCTYQLAMYLRLDANARQLQRRILVPANCVDTYDMPIDLARQIGAMPHAADLLHAVFLNHMTLNGVEVVKSIT